MLPLTSLASPPEPPVPIRLLLPETDPPMSLAPVEPLLPATIELVSVVVPPPSYRPPPQAAELPLTVQLVSVVVPLS